MIIMHKDEQHVIVIKIVVYVNTTSNTNQYEFVYKVTLYMTFVQLKATP